MNAGRRYAASRRAAIQVGGLLASLAAASGCRPRAEEVRAHDAEALLLSAPERPSDIGAPDAGDAATVPPTAAVSATFEGTLHARVAGLIGAGARNVQCSVRDNRALCMFNGEIKLGPLRATSALIDATLHTITWLSKRDKKAYSIDVEEGRDDLSRWLGLGNAPDAGVVSDALIAVDAHRGAEAPTLRTIAGRRCTENQLRVERARVCVSELQIPAFGVLARLMPLPPTLLVDAGLPLQVVTTHAGRKVVAWEVTKIETQNVPDAVFAIEPAFQSVDLLAMLRSFERIGMPVKLN